MSITRRLAVSLAAASAAVAGVVTIGSVVDAPAASAASTCRSYVYETGGSGSCVKDLQILVSLQLKYYYGNHGNDPVTWDGVFGPQTKAAVQQLQRWYKVTADGIVGPVTWNKICYVGLGGAHTDGITVAEVNAYNAAYKAAGCTHYNPGMTY